MTDGCCAIACETGKSIYRDDFCVHLIIEAANEYCRSSLSPTALNGNSELFSTVFYCDKKKTWLTFTVTSFLRNCVIYFRFLFVVCSRCKMCKNDEINTSRYTSIAFYLLR